MREVERTQGRVTEKGRQQKGRGGAGRGENESDARSTVERDAEDGVRLEEDLRHASPQHRDPGQPRTLLIGLIGRPKGPLLSATAFLCAPIGLVS